ncbi:heterokaryon incompatibility protein-domain-containing protein [Hyaloscypha finlandica]|nr:heterokaryon incompatibility protein-domain-containing protein [Hyaloscypha finlandica]
MSSSHPLQGRADCKAIFDLIRSWISQCDGHPLCTRVPRFAAAEQFQLPTRLIDIGTGTADPSIRLVLSASLNTAEDCRYVALSHCWGADPEKIPKTFSATLSQQQERIIKLTKTFEDAIEVTRQIGVRYLWIDSLCIIQDDETDFEKECSKMGLTYARAYCVLSALDAEDGSGGLFIPRTHSTPLTSSILSLGQWESMLNGPLSTRGWAFQEQQLSPRIVHFSRSRILWECRGCIAYEDSPTQVYRRLLNIGGYRNRIENWVGSCRLFDNRIDERQQHSGADVENVPEEFSRGPSIQALNNIGRNAEFESYFGRSPGANFKLYMYLHWLRAAERYSDRHLSYETDKLPAISGLAAAVALTLKEDYLAGLWKGDIIRGLLWLPLSPGVTNSPDRIPSIPSWSWASYRGGIRFIALVTKHNNPINTRYNLVESFHSNRVSLLFSDLTQGVGFSSIQGSTTTSSLDPFGRISGGTLQVTGQMKHYHIERLSISSGLQILQNENPDGLDSLPLYIFLDFWTNSMVDKHLDVVLAGLVWEVWEGGGTNTGVQGFGLVLKRHSSENFHRVGIFYGVWLGRVGDIPGFETDTVAIE